MAEVVGTGGSRKIGDDLNSWRYPVIKFGPQENGLQNKILQHTKLKGINLNLQEWDKHCLAVDNVLSPVLDGVKRFAKKTFSGLVIRDYIRQGSSRDGLKVNDALEFDCLLVFEIDGMSCEKRPVYNNRNSNEEILGLIKIDVNNGAELCELYPWLSRLEILKKSDCRDGKYLINTKNLHEKVFKALVDQTRAIIDSRLPEMERSMHTIRRSANPPTVGIHISLDKDRPSSISHIGDVYKDVRLEAQGKIICQGESATLPLPSLDIDLVPALFLRHDTVPDPYDVHYGEREMGYPVYAVMKWAHKPSEADLTVDHEYLWRESSCAYEKHILDVARRNDGQCYLMTSCRIVKSYVTWLKLYNPTNQLHRLAVSYYLKNLCFHCITLLTVPSVKKRLSGVKEALGYYLRFLELAIEKRNLPHFFYGNPWVTALFPDCSFANGEAKNNLFLTISPETFTQAEKGFQEMLIELEGMYTDFVYLDQEYVQTFKDLLL